MDAALILALVGAVIGPALAYLAASRKSQGRIRASEAGDLWEEGAAIRRECAERVRVLEAANAVLQAEVYRLQREVAGGGHA